MKRPITHSQTGSSTHTDAGQVSVSMPDVPVSDTAATSVDTPSVTGVDSNQQLSSDPISILGAAGDLSSKGFNVIPIKPKAKKPLVDWKEYQTRKSTSDEWQAWFANSPDANIAVVTGAISGLLVLDVDGEEGKRSIEGYTLPPTWTVATPNGGAHYYFRLPSSLSRNKTTRTGLLDGVDTRGEGGCVILPPSTLATGKYTWSVSPFDGVACAEAPQWLIDLLEKPTAKEAGPKDYSKISRALSVPVSAGDRHDTLIVIAGYFVSAGMPTDILRAEIYNWNETKCNPPLEVGEVDRQIDNVVRTYEKDFGRCKRTPFKLTPKAVAERLQNEMFIISVGDQIYTYSGGYYKEAGNGLDKRILGWLPPHYQNEKGVKDVRYILRVGCERKPEEVNSNANTLINVRNGLVKWTTGELLQPSPDELSTYQIHASYRPNLGCGAVEKYLAGMFSEDSIKLVEEMLGYCLILSTKYQKAFVLVGRGANGKSKFLDVVRAFIGAENASAVSLHDLSQKNHRFKTQMLRGKLINIDDDLPQTTVDGTNTFKSLVSGGLIAIEDKNIKAFTFENRAKLLFAANWMPDSTDNSYGFLRRLILIPMEQTFAGARDDKNILQKLTTETALSEWLNLALRGLKRLEANGGFSEGKSSTAAKEDYALETNNAKRFLAERTIVDPKGRVKVIALFNAYVEHCGEEKNSRMNRQLNAELRSTGIKRHKAPNEGVDSWHGIRLNPELPDALNEQARKA